MTEQSSDQKKAYSAEDVAAKMKGLSITGISSRGKFTPNERMAELEQIELIFQERKKRALAPNDGSPPTGGS